MNFLLKAECNPCKNEICTNSSINQGYCLCETEYKGISMTCPVLRGICDLYPNLCLNGGKCLNSNETAHGFTCVCPNNLLSGLRCENVIQQDPCFSVTCKNFGTCISTPCANNGTCSLSNRFTCKCTEGYSGKLCEIENSSKCEAKICNNHGDCFNGINGVYCVCKLNFY